MAIHFSTHDCDLHRPCKIATCGHTEPRARTKHSDEAIAVACTLPVLHAGAAASRHLFANSYCVGDLGTRHEACVRSSWHSVPPALLATEWHVQLSERCALCHENGPGNLSCQSYSNCSTARRKPCSRTPSLSPRVPVLARLAVCAQVNPPGRLEPAMSQPITFTDRTHCMARVVPSLSYVPSPIGLRPIRSDAEVMVGSWCRHRESTGGGYAHTALHCKNEGSQGQPAWQRTTAW